MFFPLPGNVSNDRLAVVEGGLEGAAVLGLHANDLALGPERLDSQGHAGQEARPTHRDYYVVHLGREGGREGRREGRGECWAPTPQANNCTQARGSSVLMPTQRPVERDGGRA